MGSRCKAGGIVDSKIFLELPGELSNAGQYRYLSFAHYIRGDYVLPADGMMGRFIWTTADNCTFVSNDIPYDVGQRDYFIDLFDTFNGTPEISAPTSCRLRPWWQAGRVIQIRFDPNENYTGTYVPAMTFHQEIDWFRLTKVDQVVRGAYFRIDLQLNKPVSSLQSLHYYYTNDLGNPTQHPVVQYNPPTQQPPSGSIKTYLPLTVSGGSFSWYYTSSYWNTTGVVPGEYYLCAVISDGLNESTSCSYAPVQVLS
jgi:hypothetical protein